MHLKLKLSYITYMVYNNKNNEEKHNLAFYNVQHPGKRQC